MASERRLVAVTRQLPGGALERLRATDGVEMALWPGSGAPTPEELVELAGSADGLVCLVTDRVDGALLDACPSLRVVANVAVGYDNVDVAELTRRRIPLGNTPGVLTEATADLTMALVLAAARRLREGLDAARHGGWLPWDPSFLLGLELDGARLGVVGTGRIGQAVIRRALAFGMEVVAWSRSRRALPEGVAAAGFDELLSTSDVVTLHVALNEETRHLIGPRELALMKPSALLVNTARGAVVDQRALYEALVEGRIAAAGLDVLEVEPPPVDEPLLGLDNCFVLPHLGSATGRARSAMAELAVDNVLAGLAGRRLPNCVNPEVYAS